jgi:hypothetical protein
MPIKIYIALEHLLKFHWEFKGDKRHYNIPHRKRNERATEAVF